jgi:predicted DCC family thiol-disulfide oxidoreductase YuxK
MERAIVLYDEDCGFCRWTAYRLRAWDRHRRLAFAPIQGEEGQTLLAGIPPETRLVSAHVVTPDGRIRSGGAAVAPVLERLPGGSPVASVARTFPGATDRAYRWAAARRAWFGARLGTDACAVDPSRAHAHR